jgi:hypothetical protein
LCANLLSRFLVGFLGNDLSLQLPFDGRLIAFADARRRHVPDLRVDPGVARLAGSRRGCDES